MDKDLSKSIKFGTDGWRGIIGFDFNIDNLVKVVVASSQELEYQYFKHVRSKKILIGYDRRFMAEYFAKSIVPFINSCGLEPVLTDTFVTTPSCSLYAKEFNFLGAFIITASHNPYNWLGFKIKSFKGCSVNESFTKAVEKRLKLKNFISPINCEYQKIDVKKYHLDKIKSNFDVQFILNRLHEMKLKVFIDFMHGSASKSISQLFEGKEKNIIYGIRENKDPYFGGSPPEPLINYLTDLKDILYQEAKNGIKTLGIVFDGDGDRISVIDEKGRYCSSQILLPYFINYLGRRNNNQYPVLKTVSGSDIISRISEDQNRKVIELPVGFKFIAEKMIQENIFIGGEESGGVGFGDFLPERDALFASMVLLNGIAEQSKFLYQSLDDIQKIFGPSFYDRVDINFPNNSKKDFLKDFIIKNIPKTVCDHPVINVSRIDGIKLRFANNFWLLFRFSGTEPLLRLYCEAPSPEDLQKSLNWSKNFISNAIK